MTCDVDFMKTKFSGDLNPLYVKLKEELQKNKFIDQVNYYRSTRDKKSVEKSSKSSSEQSLYRGIVTRGPKGQIRTRKKPLNNITKIQKSEKIENQLYQLSSKKLYHLYKSLCTISLVEHPYLAYIGSWAFLECIAVVMGKNNPQSFDAFYGNKLNNWEKLKDEKEIKKRIHDAIKQIHSKGNFSKHDFNYEFSDAKQLHNELKVLEDFVIKCINDIQAS